MGKLSFGQLQSHLLRVAREEYGNRPFPRFHLLSKAHRHQGGLLCGQKYRESGSKCDGYECVEPSAYEGEICWRLYRFHDHQFWAPCSLTRSYFAIVYFAPPPFPEHPTNSKADTKPTSRIFMSGF